LVVLELVEGETLAEQIQTSGPLPLAKALDCARQVAEALEAAHDKGIMHRDLKPANVKVTSQGKVKVLDFGLAKAMSVPNGDREGSQAATATVNQTLAGHIVGTPGYMSPEQASGEAVDHRTDIWAFGCLVYELLTGHRAFPGETVPTAIAAVLEREPNWQALPTNTPAKIRTLLRRCLQKDTRRRLGSIAEAREIVDQVRRGGNGWRIATIAAALLAIGVAILARQLVERQRSAARAPIMTRLTTDAGLTAYPALSPDGKLLAYASDRASNGNLDIWIQQVNGSHPIRLTTNGADDLEPNFSPDGAHIVFRSEREGGGIYMIPALGGAEQRIADQGRTPRFSPDGKWIAYWTGDKSYFGRRHVFVVPTTGGQSREIQPGFFFASHPVWSPDGQHLLFRGLRDAKSAEAGLFDWWVAPVKGGAAVQTGAYQLLRQTRFAAMERSQLHPGFGVDPSDWIGDSVFFSASSGSAGLSGSLWRAGISSRNQLKGPVQHMTSGTDNEIQPSAVGGRIAFASVTQNENIWSLSVDPNTGRVSGEPLRVTSSAAADVLPVPSVDGKKVAFASNRTGNMHVWIKDLGSGTETALTSTSASELPWLLSTDGSHVVYCIFDVTKAGDKGCFIGPTDGGRASMFCKECPASSILDWFDHGRKILYKKGLAGGTQLMLRDISSGQEVPLLLHSKYNVTAAHFSPDDQWISFQTVIDVATRRQIFIAPIHNSGGAGESEWIPITDGSGLDRNAVWSPRGNLLYFLSERDGFRCFWAQHLDPATKRPVGAPFAVYHLARRSSMTRRQVFLWACWTVSYGPAGQ
jgi:Tol biopolymer transport system component